MDCIRPASVDEMVLEFLQGEVDSPNFGPCIHAVLGGDVTIVNSPQDTPEEKARRRHVLARCRGFGMNNLLFRGFPANASWWHVVLTRNDLGKLRYGNYDDWIRLSGGTRRVADGARASASSATGGVGGKVQAIVQEIAAGRTYARLLLAAASPDAEHYILEGHSRATAYYQALADDAAVPMIAGYSERIDEWAWI